MLRSILLVIVLILLSRKDNVRADIFVQTVNGTQYNISSIQVIYASKCRLLVVLTVKLLLSISSSLNKSCNFLRYDLKIAQNNTQSVLNLIMEYY
jgi:hypothetical protein